MKKLKFILSVIDSISERVGSIGAWLVIPMPIITVYETISRYVFDSPTIWVWDVNLQIYGALLILGGFFVMKRGGHVCVDILTTRLAPRVKESIDLVTYTIFFFAFGVLAWKATGAAWTAVVNREVMSTTFAPPVYPLKVLLALGVYLLLLQGLANYIRKLIFVMRWEERGNNKEILKESETKQPA